MNQELKTNLECSGVFGQILKADTQTRLHFDNAVQSGIAVQQTGEGFCCSEIAF